jgi:hypothetical protein
MHESKLGTAFALARSIVKASWRMAWGIVEPWLKMAFPGVSWPLTARRKNYAHPGKGFSVRAERRLQTPFWACSEKHSDIKSLSAYDAQPLDIIGFCFDLVECVFLGICAEHGMPFATCAQH